MGPRSRDRTEIRPRSGGQIWSKLADLLVGRRSSACNGYVTDPSSHDECVHRTQKHRKPLSETLHHARRARHRAVARNQPHLALRPAPPRRPPHTKRWFRALAVIASGPGHPPRSTVTTRKTRRLACYVFLRVALLLKLASPLLRAGCSIPRRGGAQPDGNPMVHSTVFNTKCSNICSKAPNRLHGFGTLVASSLSTKRRSGAV